jgi:3-deoxy-D-manno-octulosonic-acid transferase
MDVLENLSKRVDPQRGQHLSIAFFPFDQPRLMRHALRRLSPRVVVLLETEIWPGLLAACKEQKVRVVIVNGRMTERSLRRYALTPGLWRSLAPQRVLAVSATDASRYKRLFPATRVTVMSNMKFDRVHSSDPLGGGPIGTCGLVFPIGRWWSSVRCARKRSPT